jgi:hypothetical protein
VDWVAWHARYDDADDTLRRRLEIVQRHIRTCLDEFRDSPVRVISLCAGEARDLLGAVSAQDRRDLVGRLVELNPELASRARRGCEVLGLEAVEVVVENAGHTGAYSGAVPADLVLVCGVFGNISDADVELTVRALPQLCAQGATVIWTRHRRVPDLTVEIRRWFEEVGFESVAFETVTDPERQGSVGVARYLGEPRLLSDQRIFTFIRTA